MIFRIASLFLNFERYINQSIIVNNVLFLLLKILTFLFGEEPSSGGLIIFFKDVEGLDF